MPDRTDREYAAKLGELRSKLLGMVGYVETMLSDAMRALTERDPGRAEATITMDRNVNRAEREIDELCLQILARWHPVASDLRLITLVLKMVTDIERMGDLAVNISERAVDLAKLPQTGPYEDLSRMAVTVRAMLTKAIDAFASRDAQKAREVLQMDDQVDELYTVIFRDILAVMGQDSEMLTRGIHVQSVAKWLERVGDHATNIAEHVVFLTDGEDIRHEGRFQ